MAHADEAGALLEEICGDPYLSQELAHSSPVADVPRVGSCFLRLLTAVAGSRYRAGDEVETYVHVPRYFTGLPQIRRAELIYPICMFT